LSKKVCFFLTHTIENYFENYSLLTSWESYLDLYSKAIKIHCYDGVIYIPSLIAKETIELKHKFGHSIKIIPLKNYITFIGKLFKELKKDEVSVIHYANFISGIFIKTCWILAKKYPTLAQYSGGDILSYLKEIEEFNFLKRYLYKKIIKLAFNSCSLFLVPFVETANEIKQLNEMKVPSSKISKFQGACFDPEIFHEVDKEKARNELKLPKDGLNILCVSRIPKPHESLMEKDPFRLVKLFNKLLRISKRNVYLHIVGWGPGKDELLKLIEELNLNEKVFYHGKIEHSRLPIYYSACDFTFLPIGCNSIWGFSAIESFACSRSVVAFRLSASSSSNQIGGLLISSDIEKGAYELNNFIDSEEFILKGKEGYEFSKDFQLSVVGKRLVSIYESFKTKY
jgi:glycosyltransferase involved in cell wall biosynthesis